MKRSAGFTLIELMIVVVVIGILASIAYPSYDGYMKRARRSDAAQLMLDISNREQQYLLDRRQYTDILSSAGLNVVRDGWSFSSSTVMTNSYYNLSVSQVDNAATPPTFTVTATAVGTQVSDGDLSITNLGLRARLVGGLDKGW